VTTSRICAPPSIELAFNCENFSTLIDELLADKKRSPKSLLTHDRLIPGPGHAIAQDILFKAPLHPRYDIADLTPQQRQDLYRAIVGTVQEVIDHGGPYDACDLYGEPGGYVRLIDKNALDRLCPGCGGEVQ